MPSLLSLVRKLKRKEREARVLMLGLDNAGKSSVLHYWLYGNEEEQQQQGHNLNSREAIAPTLGFDIRTLERDDVRLMVWDVGGQDTIRAYWRNYFEETDALVWVVDSADRLRLEECSQLLKTLLLEEKMQGASLLILANKRDLATGVMDLQTIADAVRPHHSHKFLLVPCSAVTGEGLEEGLNWLIQELRERVF
jgi:ADP-ribosylation factor-like protein 2